MNSPKPEDLKALREQYPPGTRVELLEMDDPYRPDLKAGAKGSVTSVDDMGTVHVAWDCGSSLGIVYGIENAENWRNKHMTNWMTDRLLDLKARQEAGEHMTCPRCGRDTMKEPVHTNALSRVADIYVCDKCGTNEALCAMMKNPLPVSAWACMRTENTFRADTIEDYLPVIQEHIPFLEQLFLEYEMAQKPEDFTAYRHEAQEHCPGVTQLWTEPFMVEYKAKDGTRALIRFRLKGDTPEHSIDTFEK